ncbi:hypothetical protein [Ornithinicoccus hortensis]|uniref:PH (Pleckstrin Homology) domain-containing protein n=1 Tax=Ornithinicoccus hortensis TaxID=82346 RepID=A0A542YPS6_9MICO|nr:hypothetical protein [Ornithinicoccus hortensis]TQL50113.1 hypothetical protein FB467_1216 [Ornithinicoccus hortensis]
MTIRYSKPLAITLLVVGLLLLGVSLMTEQWISVVAGGILALVGALNLANPTIKIEPHEVQLRNPLGMTLKRFPVTGPADLRFEGNRLVHVPQGKRITSLGFGFDKGDVSALRSQVQPGA